MSCEPQVPQKWRRTFGEDSNDDGVSRVNRNSARAKVTHATTGDAAARRHDSQCQIMLLAGLVVAG